MIFLMPLIENRRSRKYWQVKAGIKIDVVGKRIRNFDFKDDNALQFKSFREAMLFVKEKWGFPIAISDWVFGSEPASNVHDVEIVMNETEAIQALLQYT
jgi:hypothetical protein